MGIIDRIKNNSLVLAHDSLRCDKYDCSKTLYLSVPDIYTHLYSVYYVGI